MDQGFPPAGLPQTPLRPQSTTQSHVPYTPLQSQQPHFHYYSRYTPMTPPGAFPMYQVPFNAPTQSSHHNVIGQSSPNSLPLPSGRFLQPVIVNEPVATQNQNSQPDDLSDTEQVPGTRKRRTRSGGNTRRSRRTRLDENGVTASAPVSTSIAASATSETHVSLTATADTCGVGSIPAHSRRSASPSKNPTLNSKIFLSKLKRDKKKSTHIASDVWFNTYPCNSKDRPSTPIQHDQNLVKKRPRVDNAPFLACRFCIGHGKWHAWKNTNGQTETMRDHLQNEHWAEYRQVVLSEHLKGWESIGLNSRNKDPLIQQNEPFSLDTFHEKVVRWVAVDDQSINVVDCPELRDLLLYVGSNLHESDIPHRTRLTELILEQYEKHWKNVSSEMKASLGRISFTMDMWSNGVLKGFMAITAHYMMKDVSGHLIMRSRLIAFRQVSGSHDGPNMARSFMQVLDEYGIADRIGQITLDNASNNNTMMSALDLELTKRDIPFDCDGNRVRCFPHVINIAVKTGLSFVTTLPPLQNGQTDDDGLSADEISAVLFDNPNNSEEYRNALASDLISRVRHLVNLCRASGNRRDDFRNTVLSMREEIRNARIERSQEREGNSVDDESDYSDTTMLLERVVVLLRDVDTRWSSTFFMVDRFLELYPAIRQFVQNDPKICDTELFSPVELQVLDDIREYLFAFHSIQELASAEKTPTLSIVLPLYEGLIEILGLMKSTLPNLSHVIDVSLEKLREYTNKARVTRIYGLAMAINPTTKLDWVSDNWLRSEKDQVRNWLKNAMLEYRRTISSTTSLPTSVSRRTVPGTVSSAARAQGAGMLAMHQLKKSFARTASLSSVNSASSSQESTGSTPSDDMLVEDELRNWLDAGTLNDPEELSNFDIVRFWDLNQYKYPCLHRIALDVLPVQASAVPCERAFSSGKETDTLRRSRLSSEMMEVLQFLKHVYHSDRLNFTNSWIARVHEEVDRGTMLNIDSSMIHSMLASGKIRDLCQLMESS